MPRRWPVIVLSVGLLMYASAPAVTVVRARLADRGGLVSREMVTGRAAAALSDSGTFTLPAAPAGVRLAIPRADAESAAVAMGYRDAPSHPFVRDGEYLEKPFERRYVCWRSYYVRPVVALPPDSVVAQDVTSDPVVTWGPTWVVPVCDDAGVARTSAMVADAPTRLRVLIGDHPGDVPRLVIPHDGTFRVNGWNAKVFPAWDRGLGMMPEWAVATAAARLAGTRARVAEVPEAFMLVLPPLRPPPQDAVGNQSMPQTPVCPRWRLALDRPVTLRGVTSGQRARTATVYVVRGETGCSGVATLQIPRPAQPATLPFWYGVRPGWPRDAVLQPVNGRPARFPDPEMRSVALRVTEPVWFEEARLAP